MSGILILEQSLNGLQFGLMLFLLAAGLTLVFGIMDMINLAHGSLYMLGAFLAAALVQATGSFVLGVLLAVPATAAIGMLLEMSVLRTLYARDHLSQVLATFALILIFNEAVRIVWGPDMPLPMPAEEKLSLPGLALAASTKSLSVFQPVSLPVMSTFGPPPSSARLVKSLSVS